MGWLAKVRMRLRALRHGEEVHGEIAETLEYISTRHGLQIRKHLRTSLSNERFASATWKMKGRSSIRNAIKRGVARFPFALPLLTKCHEAVHKGSVSSSFIVLQAD